jgi:hypothetical protein
MIDVDFGGGRTNVVKSFGEPPVNPSGFRTELEAVAFASGATLKRELAAAPRGHFWSAHTLEYRVDLFTPEGRLARSIVRVANWFPPRRTVSLNSSWAERPEPWTAAIRHDAQNRLWIAIWVADANWQPQEAGAGFSPARARDTILEVIDLDALSLLASTRIDGVVSDFVGEDMMITREEDPTGLVHLAIWKLRFDR